MAPDQLSRCSLFEDVFQLLMLGFVLGVVLVVLLALPVLLVALLGLLALLTCCWCCCGWAVFVAMGCCVAFPRVA